MLIAIAGLFLVVVFLANKSPTGAASESGLPNPPTIPATGTSGVPSPASSILMQPGYGGKGAGSPLLGTNAGQLAMLTNFQNVQQPWRGNPPLPPGNVVSSVPESSPLIAKELFTQGVKAPKLAFTLNSSALGLRKL